MTYIPKDLEKPRWRWSKRKKIRRGKKLSGSCLDFSFWAALGTLQTHRPFGVRVVLGEYNDLWGVSFTLGNGKLLTQIPFWDFSYTSLMMSAWISLMWFDKGNIFVGKIRPIPLCSANFQRLTASLGSKERRRLKFLNDWERKRSNGLYYGRLKTLRKRPTLIGSIAF